MIKSEGGMIIAMKNYDGDVQSDIVAQGIWIPGTDDLATHNAGRSDVRIRSRARHCHTPLPRTPEGQRNVHEPDRFHLRVDTRIGEARTDGRDA